MNYSQAEAAKALGIHRRSIQNYENGRAIPESIDWACGALYCRQRRWSEICRELT